MLEIDKLRVGQLTFQGEVLHLMKNIIEKEKLPFNVRQEEIDRKGKRPDLIITVLEDSRWRNYCFIEIEDPTINPYDSSLVDGAGYKAFKHGVEYFVTWTVNELVLWKAFEKGTSLMERRQTYFDSHGVGLQVPTYEAALQKKKELNDFLYKFLKHLNAVYVGIEKVERPRPDEVFVRLLRSMITPISMHTSHHIWRMYQEDPDFKKKLQSWFEKEQMWSPASAKDVERAARQFAYMLVDKMFFYTILRPAHKLPDLFIPENVSGEHAREILQERFERVLKIDYENIFLTDFVDELPIPDEAVPLLSRFTSELEKYDFSDMSYEIMGNIFQGVIPPEERHVLGQYFTRSDVVDLIVGFCVKDPNAVVLDSACGAGTFLVRSYSRIKNFELGREHEKMLAQLYGVEISKFPAHLSTMNLAVRNIGARLNYPAIIHSDFFELAPSARYEIRGLGGKKVGRNLPEAFDAVITNPPYTRQEEMEKQAFPKGYREKLKKLIEKEWGLSIGKRSSIYSHFFFYGGKFLKEGGRLGLITSSSWLDVDYGKYLQEFFLRNFKIVAIIESKIERWFEDANINTAITILERCDNEERRNENMVKFVQLKRPLEEFVPATDDEWRRWEAVDKFVDYIESTNDFVEDDRIRIFTKIQKDLWEEGFWDGKYRGAKWGKYLRAPKIFFKILEKGNDSFVPLKEVAEVRRGFTTGATEFFYLTEDEIERRGVEKKFLQPIIFTLKEIDGYVLDKDNLKYKVIICSKNKEELKETKLLRYILEGETRGFHKRPTCSSREPWYSLGKGWSYAPLIFPAKVGERMPVFVNRGIFEDKKLYGVTPKKLKDTMVLAALMNSTLSRLFIEFTCRQLTGAQAIADIDVVVVESLPIFNPSKLSTETKTSLEKSFYKLSKTSCESIFKEIGTSSPEEVSLNEVKPERRKLDKIIMDEILGLTENEQLEVYKAIVDLVRSRIERARSVEKFKKGN